MGHVFTKKGLKIDPEKARAVLEMPWLVDTEGVQCLNGFVNYLAKFLPQLGDVMEPLRRHPRTDERECTYLLHSISQEQNSRKSMLLRKAERNPKGDSWTHVKINLGSRADWRDLKRDRQDPGWAGWAGWDSCYPKWDSWDPRWDSWDSRWDRDLRSQAKELSDRIYKWDLKVEWCRLLSFMGQL